MKSTVKANVARLLSLDTRYRDSDKQLVLKYWEEYNGFILTKEQRQKFFDLPSSDSITRRRRELSGKYPASSNTTERRYRHFKAYQKEFSKQGWLTALLKRRGI